MELLQFALVAAAAIGAVMLLAEPETLEEQAERLEKKRAKEGRARA